MSFIELARWDKMALHTLVYFSIKSTINQEFLSTSLSYFSWFMSLLFQENVVKTTRKSRKWQPHPRRPLWENKTEKNRNTRQLIYRMALNVCGSNFCHFWGFQHDLQRQFPQKCPVQKWYSTGETILTSITNHLFKTFPSFRNNKTMKWETKQSEIEKFKMKGTS